MRDDPDITLRLACFPTDWLPSRSGPTRKRFYTPQFAMKTKLFFTMDWDESTTIQSLPLENSDLPAAQREFLESRLFGKKDSTSIIAHCKKAWALHDATDGRVMQLASEKNELEFVFRELSHNIGSMLAPLWNWNQELMILYGKVKALQIDLIRNYRTAIWQANLHQVKTDLNFIKAQNMIYVASSNATDDFMPRGVAICVGMYQNVVTVINEIDAKIELAEFRDIPKTFASRVFAQFVYKLNPLSEGWQNLTYQEHDIVRGHKRSFPTLSFEPSHYFMPSDWLPGIPNKLRSRSILSKHCFYSYFSLDLGQSDIESDPILKLDNALQAQSCFIEKLGKASIELSEDCIELETISRLTCAVHKSSVSRVNELEQELHNLQLFSCNFEDHLLTPTWNLHREIMDLFATAWNISLGPLPLSRQKLLDVLAVRKGLQFLKEQNFIFAQTKYERAEFVPRCIAECIMLCDECLCFLDHFDSRVITTTTRAVAPVFKITESLDGLLRYMEQLRDAQEQQCEVAKLSDLIHCEYQICELEARSIKYLEYHKSRLLVAGYGSALLDEMIQRAYDVLNECIVNHENRSSATSREDNDKLAELIPMRSQLNRCFDRNGQVQYISHEFFGITARPLWKYAKEVADILKHPVMNPIILPVLDEVLGMVFKILCKFRPVTGYLVGIQQVLIGVRSNLKLLRNSLNKNRLRVEVGEAEAQYLHRFVRNCFILRQFSQPNDSFACDACLGVLRAQCFCVVRDLVPFVLTKLINNATLSLPPYFTWN